MKVLSIRQPWAWLIVNGNKDIENRTWRTFFRGDFYIHAGKKIDLDGYAFVKDEFSNIDLPLMGDLKKGGIVGMANLIGVATGTASSPWFTGPLGWVLKNARELPFVECSGRLGFFEEPRCRKCGCTCYDACPGGCYWVEPDLCSECKKKNENKG